LILHAFSGAEPLRKLTYDLRLLTGAGKHCVMLQRRIAMPHRSMLQRRKSMPQRRKRSRCGAAFICRVFENAVFSEFSVSGIFSFSSDSPLSCARAFTLALISFDVF
jgi:hypothetical protein